MSARVESRYTVPSGTTLSVSSGALTNAVTVTWAAANHYHTAAGGVTSGPAALTSAINAAVSPYPDNAASMAAAIGWGTWSAGWGLDIASGNDAGLFGSKTLTASSSPTYRNAGPGNGADYAVGFDSNADKFSAGNNFDLTAASDVAVAWVGYHSATPTDTFFSKYDGGTSRGYEIKCSAGALTLNVYDGSTKTASAASLPTGSWYVGIAVADRSTGKIRVGYCALGGTPTVSTETAQTLTTTNTAEFAMGASTWLNGTTDMKVAALYVASGASACSGLSANLSTALTNFANAVNSAFTVSVSTSTGLTTLSNSFWSYSLTWTSTNARDLLGFTGNISTTTSSTSTKQAKALWIPGSPLNCDAHPSMYPDETDTRGTESPTGIVLGLSGNVKYAHSNVRWDRVAVSQIREASATYANASLETFFRDAVSGQGHAWLRPYSPLQLYWSSAGTDTLLGCDANSSTGVAGWSPVGVSKFKDLAVPSQAGWVGQFNVRFPRLVSSG